MASTTIRDFLLDGPHALTSDAPEEDKTLLGVKIMAAQGLVERMLGFAIEARFRGEDQDPVPPALKEAVMELTA